MISSNVNAQFIGNGRVQIRMNETAQTRQRDYAQTAATEFAHFGNDIAAISYANLVNSTGILYRPSDNKELVEDVFQLSKREN